MKFNMKNRRIHFYYYSGTGNTLLAVKEMVRVFEENNCNVTLKKIEDQLEVAVPEGITIGLAFPVAFQSTFPFLWIFFKSLPEGRGTPIFMVDTMMAFSGAIVGPLKKLLTSKGYSCIGAKEIMMPNNWFPGAIDEEKNRATIKKGLQKTRRYAEDLLNGKAKWGRIPFLSAGFYHLCCNDFMMNNVNMAAGKKIVVDTERCTECGLCARLCPKDNIHVNDGYPRFGESCEVCMRCLCFCPTEALSVSDKDFARYRAVKAKDLLKSRKHKEKRN